MKQKTILLLLFFALCTLIIAKHQTLFIFCLKSFIFPLSQTKPLRIGGEKRDLTPPQTTLIAVGDIMLGRYVNVKMLKYKDFRYPFLKTAALLSSADITFGNLESPIVKNCPSESEGMIFCARPEAIEGLKFAGFDVLSLANNHILNHGQEGLEQTKQILAQNSILSSPDSEMTIYRFNNLSFGFLSFDLTTSIPPSLISQISLISPTVDVLIVSLHWGNEYAKEPSVWQKKLAPQIIDAGSKVVIGHHPHVIQPIEEYKDGLIFYSLGNFVFDQSWSKQTQKGLIAKIIFEGKNVKSYELVPVEIKDSSQPNLIEN